MIIDFFSRSQKRLDKLERKISDIDKNEQNTDNSVKAIERELGSVRDKIQPIYEMVEKENEQESEMNQSLWNMFLKAGLQLFLAFGAVACGFVGAHAYINLSIYNNIMEFAVAIYVILGNLLLAFNVAMKLIIDIFKDDMKKTRGMSVLKEGILVRKLVGSSWINQVKTYLQEAKDKIIECVIEIKGKVQIKEKVEKEFWCIMTWLLLLNVVFQLGIVIYAMFAVPDEWKWILIGVVSYVLILMIMEIRGQILKGGYTYIYNLVALSVAFVSLFFSLGFSLEDLLRLMGA